MKAAKLWQVCHTLILNPNISMARKNTQPIILKALLRHETAAVALAFITLITFFGMFSSKHGKLMAVWFDFIGYFIGWGVYYIWVITGFLTGWIIFAFSERNDEQWEKPIGAFMLIIWLSIVLETLFVSGGVLGQVVSNALTDLIGFAGVIILLVVTMPLIAVLIGGIRIYDIYQNIYTAIQQRIRMRNINTHQQIEIIDHEFTEESNRVLPNPAMILRKIPNRQLDESEIRATIRNIENTLENFGIVCKVVESNRGPRVTQYSLEQGYTQTKHGSKKVRVSQIVALREDIALALSASSIRIEAPIPGRPYIGIEVPNRNPAIVGLRLLMESVAFRKSRAILKIVLGQSASGIPIVLGIEELPHLLIAGSTGSGKSVCIHSILACLLLTHVPDELRLTIIDPKLAELANYNRIPHSTLINDTTEAVIALKDAVIAMNKRYELLQMAGVRDIETYNRNMQRIAKPLLPYHVIIIDELADLMLTTDKVIESTLIKLAQKARAVGIHLVLATQRPSVDVVTGLIKANFPSRIAFTTASGVDSKVILDATGAENLLGKGDMLFKSPNSAQPIRIQGVFIDDNEIRKLVQYWT